MGRARLWLLGVGAACVVGLAGYAGLRAQVTPTLAATQIYASPVQAGCYIAGPNDCRIHIEPFTLNLAPGSRVTSFQLKTYQAGSGQQSLIHDFRPDLSNPVPLSGSTYTPSLVAQDYACSCGKTYSVLLQGRDSLDSTTYNLGQTGQFTCPTGVP